MFKRCTVDARALAREWEDAQPTVTRCVLCPAWSFEGTALEGREAAAAHRLAVHPELVGKPRRKRSSGFEARSADARQRGTDSRRRQQEAPQEEHGAKRYTAGCRCGVCTAGWAAYHAKYHGAAA